MRKSLALCVAFFLLFGCIGCHKKDPAVVYAQVIGCYQLSESNWSRVVTDEAQIKAFTDMLNACTFREATAEEREQNPHSPGFDGYRFTMGERVFWLNENGFYAETGETAEEVQIKVAQNFDKEIFLSFIAARHDPENPTS